MAGNREMVWVERENEKGQKQAWRYGFLTIDDMAGTLMVEPQGSLFGGKWQIVLKAGEIAKFEITLVTEPVQMAMMYGGGLIGYAIAALVARSAKTPAIHLESAAGGPGERWVNLRGVGLQGRSATRKLANRLTDLLRQQGYKGMMPDLSDESLWKFPIVPVAIGCGAAIVLIILFIAVLAALGYYS